MTSQAAVSALSMTPAAQAHIQKIMTRQKGAKGIRLGIKDAGCSGKSYVVSLVLPEDSSRIEDTVCTVAEGLSVYIDPESLKFLKGCQIDYEKKGLTGKLVFHNPQQKALCGCGESFYV